MSFKDEIRQAARIMNFKRDVRRNEPITVGPLMTGEEFGRLWEDLKQIYAEKEEA